MRLLENNLHSDLSDGSVFTKNIVHLIGSDFIRQITNVQHTVHLWRQTNLEFGEESKNISMQCEQRNDQTGYAFIRPRIIIANMRYPFYKRIAYVSKYAYLHCFVFAVLEPWRKLDLIFNLIFINKTFHGQNSQKCLACFGVCLAVAGFLFLCHSFSGYWAV